MIRMPLPRSTPQAENISEKGIRSYLETIRKSALPYHSIMMIRNGKVIEECFFGNYTPETEHPVYSVAKVITATACCFARNEKLFDIHDKVISFFPEKLPVSDDARLEELEIYHLLTMTVGHEAAKLSAESEKGNKDWISLFLSAPVIHPPGTVFEYNNLASYMLSAIIQKLSEQKLIDYIRPRLFDPLGIEQSEWEESPQGINTGGWGISLKTEDMAKLGLFLLQKGQWENRELLPENLVEETCSFQVPTAPETATDDEKSKSDWLQGYGYHIWRSRHNAFSAYGFHGQLIVVLPDKNTVLVTTAKIGDMQGALNLIWKYILPSLKT